MESIRELFIEAVRANPDGIAIRWKSRGNWNTLTYTEYMRRVKCVSEAAHELKLKPGDRAALIMENRPNWMITYLGLSSCGIEVVPVDAKLREGEVSHILRDSESKTVFAGGKLWPLIQGIERGLPKLESVVVLDHAVQDEYKENGIRHYDFDTLMAKSAEKSGTPQSYFDSCTVKRDDVASIIYTSGTTGRPKGAMLMHGNFMGQLEGALQFVDLRNDDNFLLVLPLHHAFAFTANFLVPLAKQCEISLVENLRTVAENMREVSPSILLAVPLLAEKMLNAITNKLKKNPVASIGMKIGLSRLIGRKVIESLGGRLRIIICGGAAADGDMLKKLNAFGIETFEGYGLTETAPICALNPEKAIKYGSVGKPLPNIDLRIAHPNEEGVGEIQVKGPIVMKGYFRNEAATAEVFENGWFMTGDLGTQDKDGYVRITGRKKSLIVNREGKNIYPDEVEIAINASPFILESVVIGYHDEGEKGERVGAIIVPDMDSITAERGKNGESLSDDDIVKLCTDEARKAVQAISEYKRPRKIQVRFEPLERTTTQKVKRYLYHLS